MRCLGEGVDMGVLGKIDVKHPVGNREFGRVPDLEGTYS
jgi:hypothetical protein